MNLLITILEFVLALGFLIFLHEFGHYIMAKIFKIPVEEFGFGFPPRMVKLFRIGETDFTLNWIPFGAFVRPKGEENPNEPGGLAAAKPLVRIAVLLGGPVMNVLTGILLFALFFTQIGIPDPSKVLIMEVQPDTPAATAGLREGDRVLTINETPITDPTILSEEVRKHLGEEITLTLERGGENLEFAVTPREEFPSDQGPLGITMGAAYRQASFFEAIPMGGRMAYEQAKMFITLPAQLIQGTVAPEEARIMGPKAIYDVFSQARERDVETADQVDTSVPVNTLGLLATISVALGLTNLLPIPALDGGRILFSLPELITGKRIPAKWENMIHLIGFAALLLLMLYITSQDILNPVVLP
ncbi:MAG TPA: M50 family metallopeptidase [Anaerolineaceae bacterium]|nr:M50 family metallopeptidase [Anaerolineaceae bacterium]